VFQKYDAPVYFVTMCTADRQAILAAHDAHDAFRAYAERGYRERTIAVGRYVLMPDHVHLFVSGGADFNLEMWARGLKRAVSKVVAARVTRAVSLKPESARDESARETRAATPDGIWQRGFFDHLLRSEESYAEKWEYVRQNPVRAGLVARAEDWPFQGEIVAIDRV
jgi:REP element-mobilizing transposase RayT